MALLMSGCRFKSGRRFAKIAVAQLDRAGVVSSIPRCDCCFHPIYINAEGTTWNFFFKFVSSTFCYVF